MEENLTYRHIITGDIVDVTEMNQYFVDYTKRIPIQVGSRLLSEFRKPMHVFKAIYRKQFAIKK